MSDADDLKVKAAVRERDGQRCTRCGMTADEHIAGYGRTLHVHREQPESCYAMEGCLTLCVECHADRHRELKEAGVMFVTKPHHTTLKPPAPKTTAIMFRLDDSTKAKIEVIREWYGLPSMAAAVRYAVEQTHRGLSRKTKNP